MGKTNNPLSPKDNAIMNAGGRENWIPPDPAAVLRPYIEKAPEEDLSEIEARRKKAKEVYEGYDDVAKQCRDLKEKIVERCKNVKIPLTDERHSRVKQALRRVFGFTDIDEITFDMYRIVVEEMQKLNNNSIPKPR